MWRRSASFILDNRLLQGDTVTNPESRLLSPPSSMAETLQNPNPDPTLTISPYYQTRAAHHGVVTSDWLAQAQAAAGGDTDTRSSEQESSLKSAASEHSFPVIDEFNNWRKQPDLAEAVAAIKALASVIRSSEATTMMELQNELKTASDSLKVCNLCNISIDYVTFNNMKSDNRLTISISVHPNLVNNHCNFSISVFPVMGYDFDLIDGWM